SLRRNWIGRRLPIHCVQRLWNLLDCLRGIAGFNRARPRRSKREEGACAMRRWRIIAALVTALGPFPTAYAESFDVIIRDGEVIDGTGTTARRADVGIRDGRIAAIGDLEEDSAGDIVDASGMAVTPGFINVLSWAT